VTGGYYHGRCPIVAGQMVVPGNSAFTPSPVQDDLPLLVPEEQLAHGATPRLLAGEPELEPPPPPR